MVRDGGGLLAIEGEREAASVRPAVEDDPLDLIGSRARRRLRLGDEQLPSEVGRVASSPVHHSIMASTQRREPGDAKRVAADQASSSVGNSTSSVSSCSAAATGIATSAPTIPNSAAPIRTATIVTPAGTLTALPITLGTNR